jgi:hypothetical protein
MKLLTISAILVTAIGMFGSSANAAEPGAKSATQESKPMRVGIFDSRVVALACYRKFLRSPEFTAAMNKLKKEHEAAKAAGQQDKAKELEAQGKAGQEHSHSQVFGSATIDDVLAKIKDQLPEIAKQAGVDLIVSKWNIAYQSPDAKFIDVTEPMAKLFQPDEQTWKMLRDLPKHPPVSEEELRKHGAD